MAAWLGVVSAEHVARAMSLGIAQINHGKRAGLARMRPGDWLIYYSPRQRVAGNEPVRAFTAIGALPDDEIWQVDEGSFTPWRRRVDYRVGARWAPVEGLRGRLGLTAGANWGYQLRRGLVPLGENDFAVIYQAMTGAPTPATSADQAAAASTAGVLW